MARVKGRVPLTFSLSPEVLSLVDAHAQTVGLDRYDVIRMAIAKGVVVLRFEHELLMDRDGKLMTALMSAADADDADAAVEHLKVFADVVPQGLERDVPGGPSKLKRRRKVKDDGL